MRILCKIKKRHSVFSSHHPSKVSAVVSKFFKHKRVPYYAENLEIFFENGLVFFESDKGSMQIREGDVLILPHVEVHFELKGVQHIPQSKIIPESTQPLLDPNQKDYLDFLFRGNAVNFLNNAQKDFPRI